MHLQAVTAKASNKEEVSTIARASNNSSNLAAFKKEKVIANTISKMLHQNDSHTIQIQNLTSGILVIQIAQLITKVERNIRNSLRQPYMQLAMTITAIKLMVSVCG